MALPVGTRLQPDSSFLRLVVCHVEDSLPLFSLGLGVMDGSCDACIVSLPTSDHFFLSCLAGGGMSLGESFETWFAYLPIYLHVKLNGPFPCVFSLLFDDTTRTSLISTYIYSLPAAQDDADETASLRPGVPVLRISHTACVDVFKSRTAARAHRQ